jgi:hypothetical protein
MYRGRAALKIGGRQGGRGLDGVQETNLVTIEHQRGVRGRSDINVTSSEVDRSEINPEMLDMLMTVKERVARLAGLICIPGVVDIKDPPSLVRVVCVGASEIMRNSMLGALELTNGGIKPCTDRKPWLLAIEGKGT